MVVSNYQLLIYTYSVECTMRLPRQSFCPLSFRCGHSSATITMASKRCAARLSQHLSPKSRSVISFPSSLWLQAPLKHERRHFSATRRNRIMEMSGFTEEQLTVRDAIQKICSQFPNEYWQQHEQSETDPKELHTALAADGWLGIALPEEFGGAGLGISEATMMLQTISQSGAGMAGAQSIHANVYAVCFSVARHLSMLIFLMLSLGVIYRHNRLLSSATRNNWNQRSPTSSVAIGGCALVLQSLTLGWIR